ncbi:unnamed protein product [Allacma fusca]|uniref:Death-associated protein 1 n=1 Tax=Allacma fusca TaxID=39272 RepID=A0A8J2PKI6_9HEXA|nr:unnamed protein product [Allacma fusca]
MSSPEKSDLLANHPPAVKAGGMRIVQNKSHLQKKSDTTLPEPQEELKVSSSPPKQSEVTISGAPNRGNADFPVEAVQAFHEKPHPTHDVRNNTKPQIGIQQPRK